MEGGICSPCALAWVVEDVVLKAVLEEGEGFGLDGTERVRVVRAWDKVLRVQNDLFARWFVVDKETGEPGKEL
jgi:hypothetical protein